MTISGCKTNSSINCPDFATAKKTHAPILSFGHHKTNQGNNTKPALQSVSNESTATINPNLPLTAAATSDMRIKIKLPTSLGGQLETDKELEDMNKLLAGYSNNKVALQRNEQGKLFLRAHSVKDIFAFAKKVSSPKGYYERKQDNARDASGSAIASVVLGSIGLVFSWIPFLSFAAILISLAAIITGAIGLRSHRRRLAIAGLVMGIIGLIISVIMSLYWMVVFFSLIIIGL